MMSVSLAADDLDPGTVVDRRYVIQQEIGRGNMSTVYLARDELVNRDVVLKIMSARLLARPDRVQRFFNEHRFVARVGRHDNIVTTLGDGRTDGDRGAPYLVMERVVGLSLDIKRALERDFEPERAARITLGVARGLRAVHAAGVVHRDVKPGNVLIARGEDGETEVAKLLDFGLAVLMGASEPGDAPRRLTRAGQLPGSAGYMPPESVIYAEPHPSADVFGLGVLLAETIVGRPPYDGVPRDEYLADIAREDWSFPPRVLDRIESPELHELVVDCTQRDPVDRPALDEVIARLETLVSPTVTQKPAVAPAALPVTAHALETPPPEAKKAPARRIWLWVTVAVLLMLGAVGVALRLGGEDDEPPTDRAAKASAQHEAVAAPSTVSTTGEAEARFADDVADDSELEPLDVEATDDEAPSAARDDEPPAATSGGETVPARPTRRQRKPSRDRGKKPVVELEDDNGAPEPTPPAAGPDEAECNAIRRSIADMRKRGLWSRIPFLAEASRACFDAKEYRRIRVEAFAESGRRADCIKAAGDSKDPKVRAWVEQCNEKQ